MHAALGAAIVRTHSALSPCAALLAVTYTWQQHSVMILCQCDTSRGKGSCTLRPSIGRQTLHEFASELHPEGEVRLVGVLDLPQPECVENADIDEPPHQTCPALTTLPAWQIGVVQLIDHIDSAGVMEVVTDRLGQPS